MVRDVVVHLLNEQPLVADLFEMPTPSDTGLLCTNLRTLAGKRPVFVDASASVFFFPYAHIRFVEVRPGSEGGPDASEPDARRDAEPSGPPPEPEDLEIDEDFLRRVREA